MEGGGGCAPGTMTLVKSFKATPDVHKHHFLKDRLTFKNLGYCGNVNKCWSPKSSEEIMKMFRTISKEFQSWHPFRTTSWVCDLCSDLEGQCALVQ